jgi:hypothetical protein
LPLTPVYRDEVSWHQTGPRQTRGNVVAQSVTLPGRRKDVIAKPEHTGDALPITAMACVRVALEADPDDDERLRWWINGGRSQDGERLAAYPRRNARGDDPADPGYQVVDQTVSVDLFVAVSGNADFQ